MAFSLHDYQIIAEIGQGGFGTVFRARQKSLGREVAIKRLSPQRTQDNTEILRFRREAEALATLTHDNILTVFDYAYYNGNYYIVMEYIDGIALEAALEAGISRQCALFILLKVAGALKCAHAARIAHRDIKPGNILLGKNGQVKLADFGLAMFSTGITRQTMAGSVLGTIGYLAPEALVSPKDVDERIDIFALGCVLYHALSGTMPFPGTSIGDISYGILNKEPAAPIVAGVPHEVIGLTMRCLQKDREKRPAIDAVEETLRTSVGSGFHEVQEELTGFVRQRQTPNAEKPLDTIAPIEAKPARARHSGKPVRRLWAGVAGGIGLLALIGLVIYFLARSHGLKPQPDLPQLPALQGNTVSSAVQSAVPKSNTALRKGGPAPLVGPTLEMAPGTLVLQGLAAADSVFVNGKSVTVVRQGSEWSAEVVNGYCHILVREADGRQIAREVEVLPFQRVILDLKNKRSANGRDYSR
jgi:serine/threonine protein kinase